MIPPEGTATQLSLQNEAYEYAYTLPSAAGWWAVVTRSTEGKWRVACYTHHQQEARDVFHAIFHDTVTSMREVVALFGFHPWDGKGFKQRRGGNGSVPQLHRFGRGLSA